MFYIFPKQYVLSLVTGWVLFPFSKPPFFPLKAEWVLWHVILIAPIIAWAFIVCTSICPWDSRAMSVRTQPTIALLNMQLNSCGWENKWKPKTTCLTGTSKDSQHKCKITSYLDSWMPNASNPYYSKDHLCRFCSAEAVVTKQILFVSVRQVYIYSLKVGAQTPSAGGRHSGPMWHCGLE